MSKIIVIILFTCVVMCTGLPREQEPSSEDRYESEEDKYELESKQDFNRTAEKEKELRLLRKAKKLKETNYRRALESILPAKSSQSYRRLFEDLINSSKEHSKISKSPKETEEVVVTDTFLNDNESEGRDAEPQVEEIEVVIERITNDDDTRDGNDDDTRDGNDDDTRDGNNDNTKVGNDDNNKPSLVSWNPSSYESKEQPFQEEPSRDSVIESIDREQPLQVVNVDEDVPGRTAQDSSAEMDNMHMGNMAQRTVIESYPVSRVSEVVIPHYRTALTRSGVVVSPALYTVKTSTPIVDHVTTRSWVPNGPILPDIYGTSNSGRSDRDTTFIDDYKDYSRNVYRYSPSRSLFAHRQGDRNMGILPKLSVDSLQPQFGVMQPLRDSMHAGTFYSQPQRFYPNNYRPMFNIHR